LGHGNTTDKWILTLIETGDILGKDIIFIATGVLHSMALEATGTVRTWGFSGSGQLGHNNLEDRLMPTAVTREAFNMHKIVSVAEGRVHSVGVMMEGNFWVWGNGYMGQLGLDNQINQIIPIMIGKDTAFGESDLLSASCGTFHMMAVTKDGALWTFGKGAEGALDHNDRENRLVPTRVEAQHFGNANVVSIAGVVYHSAAVTEDGTLFTWGTGDESKGLGHSSGMPMWIPTRVDPSLMLGARIGPCHKLQPMRAMAFAMGTHSRLGGGCVYVTIPGELVQRVIEAYTIWPEGRTGELDGMVQMLGGGMMRAKGSI